MSVTIKLKRGPLNREDKDFIQTFRGRLTAEQIAAQRRRPVSVVEKYLETLAPLDSPPSGEKAISMRNSLRLRPEWKQFELQFLPEELEHFEYKYIQFMTDQFTDMKPTDEMQLYHVLTLDIMSQRVMKEQKFIHEEMGRLERCIRAVEEKLDEEEGQEGGKELKVLKQEYETYRSALRSLTQRIESYLTRQSVLLRELKSTRDQRIKVLEGSDQSFLGYLKRLQDEEFREQVGRDMELVRKAADKEAQKLSQPHQYVDGVEDLPLLTPETIDGFARAEELEEAELERLKEKR